MKIIANNLYNKEQTGSRMYFLIDQYAHDLCKFAKNGIVLPELSILEYFDFVKNIPYRRDIAPTEVISRPKHILKHRKIGMDCKKKAILISSWAKLNNIPYRLIASSSRANGKIHHVFPQINLSGHKNHDSSEWINADATYKKLKFGQPRPEITNFVVLPRNDEPEMMGYVLEIIAAVIQTGAKITGWATKGAQKRRASEMIQNEKTLNFVNAVQKKQYDKKIKEKKEIFSISMLTLGLIAIKLLKKSKRRKK